MKYYIILPIVLSFMEPTAIRLTRNIFIKKK